MWEIELTVTICVSVAVVRMLMTTVVGSVVSVCVTEVVNCTVGERVSKAVEILVAT